MYCSRCAKDEEDIVMNKCLTVQLMINKLDAQCLTVTVDQDIGNNEVEGVGSTMATGDQLECCEWRGAFFACFPSFNVQLVTTECANDV